MAKKKTTVEGFETREEYAKRVQEAADAAGSRRFRPPQPKLVEEATRRNVGYTDAQARRSGEKVLETRKYSNGVTKNYLVKQIRKNRPKTAQTEVERLKERVAELEKRGVG